MTDPDNSHPADEPDHEPEVSATPSPYDYRYQQLGNGCYRKKACPHDE